MHDMTRYPIETPLGEIDVYALGGRPVEISLAREGAGLVKGPEPERGSLLRDVLDGLRMYFEGHDSPPELFERIISVVDPSPVTAAFLEEVHGIPRGETLSYGEVAVRAGHPRAARAVGNAMRSNRFPLLIPCHRVIKADGTLGGFGGREDIKEWLLDFEGALKSPEQHAHADRLYNRD